MWFEMIPSFCIVVVALSVPHYINPVLNKVLLGNWYQRTLMDKKDRDAILRDERLTGNSYDCLGLKDIPDAPPAKK